MRRILIVGAGQAGLQLALGLQHHGYDVTVMTDRSPEAVRAGRVLSTQCMFATAMRTERALGLDFWSEEAPQITGIGVSVAGPPAPPGPPAPSVAAAPVIDWLGRLRSPAQSVDQRLKMPAWLETFSDRGGRVVVRPVGAGDVAHLAGSYDLVLVATGRGGLGSLFERDEERCSYDRPQRALGAAYVQGLAPRTGQELRAVNCNLVPGVGELFVLPGLTAAGPCDVLLWEAVPGGPADAFDGLRDPAEHLRVTLELMRAYVPWEYERTRRGVELTDSGATLAARFTPVVRRPVGELPGGGAVLGAADAVVTNDPITGQGSNNAAKCAAAYLEAILAHGEKPFDRDFMQAAFDRFWDTAAGPSTVWTNAMLAPPPPHVLDILAAGGRLPAVAHRFANAFDDPTGLGEWFLDPRGAADFLASAEASARA